LSVCAWFRPATGPGRAGAGGGGGGAGDCDGDAEGETDGEADGAAERLWSRDMPGPMVREKSRGAAMTGFEIRVAPASADRASTPADVATAQAAEAMAT
jgi:hypothetical protein